MTSGISVRMASTPRQRRAKFSPALFSSAALSSDRLRAQALDHARHDRQGYIAAAELHMFRPDAKRQLSADDALSPRHRRSAVWPFISLHVSPR